MGAFQQASEIETIAKRELMPWLMMKCDHIEEVPPGLFLQKLAGDFIVTQSAKRYGVELKAEQRHTGNLFLETWSNRPEMTFGWLWTSRADWLMYYFVDNAHLYILDMAALQRWARDGAIYRYTEKPQARYDQLNYTYGRVVPINDIQMAGVPVKRLTAEERT